MSTSTLSPAEPATVHFEPPSPEEFNYRPMSLVAVLAFALSLLSLATMFLWFLIPLGVVAAILAGVAIMRIRSSRGEFTGMKLASTAAFLAVLAVASGVGYQVFAYKTEVREGYERISFLRDISSKGFVVYENQRMPHPDLFAMEGKKIFLKGFMYPTGQVFDLKSFLLVKDTDQCCFGGNPKIEDMLGVYMKGPELANFYSGRVSVAGTFRLNREYKGGEREAIFLLDGVEVKPSSSDFDPVKPLDLTAEREKMMASAKEQAEEAQKKAAESVSAQEQPKTEAAAPSTSPPADAPKTIEPAEAPKTTEPPQS